VFACIYTCIQLTLFPASTRGHTPINRTQPPAPSLCDALAISFIILVTSIVLNQALEAQLTARRGWDKALSTSDRACVLERWSCAVCGAGRGSLIPRCTPLPTRDSQRSKSTLDVREHQGECYFTVLRFTRTSNDHTRLGVRHPLHTAPLICNASINDVHSPIIERGPPPALLQQWSAVSQRRTTPYCWTRPCKSSGPHRPSLQCPSLLVMRLGITPTF